MGNDNATIILLENISPQRIYTVSELAPILKTAERTIRRYCADGIFKHAVKLAGTQWRIPGKDVRRLFPHLSGEPDAIEAC